MLGRLSCISFSWETIDRHRRRDNPTFLCGYIIKRAENVQISENISLLLLFAIFIWVLVLARL